MKQNFLAKHILVEGHVQGVFFRKNTRQKAIEFQITGWVRNTDDDKVEIFAQGNNEDLNNFIEWCKTGPSKASVINVIINEINVDSAVKDFSIVYAD